MKKIIGFVITILLLNIPTLLNESFAQAMADSIIFSKSQQNNTDSTLLDFFPLKKGNIWQYRHRDTEGSMGFLETMISYGDTIMPNGKKYTKLLVAPYGPQPLFCRIDSLFRIQEYIDSLTLSVEYDSLFCDSSTLVNKEVNTFRLNEPDSAYWYSCYNIGDNLFWPGLRYMGEYLLEVFQQTFNAKVFRQYFKMYDTPTNEWIEFYGHEYILLKGIGIYSAGFQDEGTATLEGAIINGIQYGIIVSVHDRIEHEPESFSLFQNYPNPFNSQTIIKYFLEEPEHIKLEIYNTLGEVISTLVDDSLDKGLYVKQFNAENLSSGIYYMRLSSVKQILTRKMLYLK